MDPILSDLNEAQRKAVTHTGGPLLVVAGAGSGKTRVITRRIAWRIREGLRPWEVLAITFTNKAAGEMRSRVDHLVQGSGVWVSTFHALGARFLRMEADACGIERSFTIYDAADQLVLIRELLKERRMTGSQHRAREYQAAISRWKNRDEPPPDDAETAHDPERRIYRAYEKALQDSQALDFDDLLLRPVRALESNEELRQRFAGRFKTILIDEYQDTNPLQFRLTRLLAADHGDVCATGDPDQSIYRWRGAEVRNILEFDADFAGAQVVKLEENYRSTNNILRAASALIANNSSRIERDLWSRLGDGELLRILDADSDRDEALQVVRCVQHAMDQGMTLDQISLLYRTNACSRSLEWALRQANLPYMIVGAVEFYERREVKDLLAYLRVIANRHNALDLVRVINVPPRGIGARTVARLREHASASGRPLRDVLVEEAPIAGLRSDRKRALAGFSLLLRELLEAPVSPVAPLLDLILARTDYLRYLEEEDDPLVDERLENVEELRQALKEYDQAHPTGALDEFLNETALLRSRDPGDEHVPRITLMTLHAAKGLEFPAVFITSMEEGVLPHARSGDSEEALEEERRLLYVGMTRAKQRLTLSFARSRPGGAPPYGASIPSRFLREIPGELVEGGWSRPAQDWEADESLYFEPEPLDGEPPFVAGDQVLHDRFGVGHVLGLSGFGPTAKVRVDFLNHGEKLLVLEYAGLQKARGEGSHG
ncbi:MAG: UvrD-helicase domain-containing protein [Planctomycetota bacterium]